MEHQLRTEHARVLLRAGYRAIRTTSNQGEFISEELVFKGPHPIAESDHEAFCEVMVDALGLPQPAQ